MNLLNILHNNHIKATWFVLGWVAEKYPEIIQEINHFGHEIACHSFHHKRIDTMTPDEFRKDTERAINAIFKAVGNQPLGYRAPSWSINDSNTWAFEILSEFGFRYDSSIFPIKHDIYGWPDGPRFSFKMKFNNGNSLIEIPATTYRLFGKNIPLGGGGYFRHSPYWYTKNLINNLNSKNHPVVFYVHPWEIDGDLPRIEGLSMINKFRSYSSTTLLKHKMIKMIKQFDFTTFADYLQLFKMKKIGF
jgi:polysaccharide deacetylase family protein (PEP-CTERM system associated)